MATKYELPEERAGGGAASGDVSDDNMGPVWAKWTEQTQQRVNDRSKYDEEPRDWQTTNGQ